MSPAHLTHSLKQNVFLRRFLIIAFSSLTILTSAAACSLPGFNNSQSITLGVLKRDPSVRADGFGRVNNVIALNGQSNPQGLASVSGLKLAQRDSDTLYLLTKQKGLFQTDDGGRTWNRKYIFPVGSQNSNENQRNQEIRDQIARNDSIVAGDLFLDPNNDNTLYVTGKFSQVGKIWQSTNSGNSFKEIYSEVENNVGVLFVTVNPANSSEIIAVLEKGAVIRSTDSGQTWQKIRSFNDVPVQLGFVSELGNTLFILLQSQGLFTSSDSGNTWNQQNLTKQASQIGENQPQDRTTLNQQPGKFGAFEKIEPVTANQNAWILIADRQMWYTEGLQNPFTKLVLPLQSEQYNLLDVSADPERGLDRLLVSVDNKLFETENRGETWSTGDKIGLTNPIGNIGQILIDRENDGVIYLMLVSPNARRGSGVFGGF